MFFTSKRKIDTLEIFGEEIFLKLFTIITTGSACIFLPPNTSRFREVTDKKNAVYIELQFFSLNRN